MEGNVLSLNHLDENVLPPPRKRLLAGLKKQNKNSSDHPHSAMSVSPPTTPPEVACAKSLLSYHSSGGSSSSSLEDIAESSNKAAVCAVKTAEAARAAAEKKAAVAAKAIAAARSALKLVEVFSDCSSGIDRHTKRNMSKKQVAVHSLHKKSDEVESGKTDETEHKSHQALYTPPSIFIHSQTSADSKTHKHKKSKVSPVIGKPEFPDFPNDGSLQGNSRAMCNGKATLDTESSSPTKLISSNWRVEKDIVSNRRKARKQLIQMVESQVDLS